MYNSLTFYYSNSCLRDDVTEVPFPLNVPAQLQSSNEWFQNEHFQHQQWTSALMRDYETSYCYDVQAFVSLKPSPIVFETVALDYTTLLITSSKLSYSQLTMGHTQSIFPGLLDQSSLPLKVQPIAKENMVPFSSKLSTLEHLELQNVLPKFVAWFKFSKIYLSFYLRKINLEENSRLSETFSNRLICHWLTNQTFTTLNESLLIPFTEPTPLQVHNHLIQMKERIQRMKAMSQSALIVNLNSLMNQWLCAWSLFMRWPTLSYCELRLKYLLQRWSKRRHPNKGWKWVCQKYWRGSSSSKKYAFWLWLLRHVSPSSNPRINLELKHALANRFQTNLYDSINLETTAFLDWQFCCSQSKENLLSYTTMPFKKWRKGRSFEQFLLY